MLPSGVVTSFSRRSDSTSVPSTSFISSTSNCPQDILPKEDLKGWWRLSLARSHLRRWGVWCISVCINFSFLALFQRVMPRWCYQSNTVGLCVKDCVCLDLSTAWTPTVTLPQLLVETVLAMGRKKIQITRIVDERNRQVSVFASIISFYIINN